MVRWWALSTVLLGTSACIFELPPLAEECTGDACPPGGTGGRGQAGGGDGGDGDGGGDGGGGEGGSAPIPQLATESDEVPQAIAIAANGDVLIAGTFVGELRDPARGTLTSRGRDGFVARLAPDGTPRWTVAAGSDLDDDVLGPGSLVELSTGEVLVAVRLGNARRSVWTPAGDESLPSSTNEDAFILLLGADGSLLDLGHIDGQTAASSVRTLVSAPDGGYWFGGSWGTSTNGALVGRVDGSGSLSWLVSIDSEGSEAIHALVPIGGDVAAIGTDAGGILALRLDASGSPVWATGFSSATPPDVRRAVALADGRIAVVGSTASPIQVAPAAPIVPTGDGDGFVVIMTTSGVVSAATSLGDATARPATSPLMVGGQGIFDAVAFGGGLVVSGTFNGQLPGAAGPAATDHDGFVVQLDGALGPLAVTTYRGPNAQWGAGVALDTSSVVHVLVGTYDQVEGADVRPGGDADIVVLPTSF